MTDIVTCKGLALAILVCSPGPLSGQEWRDFGAARQAGTIESLEVELWYGVGTLTVSSSESTFLYNARVRYDTERFQPLRGWSTDGERGKLRLALTSISDETGSTTVRFEDWDIDFDFDDLKRSRDEPGTFDFDLHPGIPTDLRVAVGAAASNLELGDLSLTSVEVLTGASKTEIAFSRPNRVRMSDITFRAGASEFDAQQLGNARFDHLEFTGAIGDVTLDFSGAWERDASAEIKMGIGELKLRVPADIGVRLERSSLLIALDAEGFEKVDGVYLSPNWDSADIRLEISLEAAFGSVKIERTDQVERH